MLMLIQRHFATDMKKPSLTDREGRILLCKSGTHMGTSKQQKL